MQIITCQVWGERLILSPPPVESRDQKGTVELGLSPEKPK